MNTTFSLDDKRLLIIHLAADPGFQRAVLLMKEGVAASGWNPTIEMPYQMLWRSIEGLIDGKNKVNPVAVMSKMSELPEYATMQSSPVVVQEIRDILGQVDTYNPAGGREHAMSTLQRFLDTRVALEAANRHVCDDIAGQVNFLKEQLAAVQVTGATSDEVNLDGALSAKIPLADMYNRAPVHVRRLTCLLTAANPKVPSALHFFTARSLVHGLLGKKLSMVNNGTLLYPAFWFVGLANTGMGKTAVARLIKEAIKQELGRWNGKAPAHPISDHFTIPFLFSEMGEIVGKKQWQGLSDDERFTTLERLERRARRRPARIMVSDEFGQNLGILLSSGSDRGEKGSLLKLADSGGRVDGDTSTDGKRAIFDICMNIIAFSQPEVWAENFDPAVHLTSGLAGRFTVVNHDSFELNLTGVQPMMSDEIIEQIQVVIRDIFTRAETVATRVICERNTEHDEYGAIFEQLLEDPMLKEVVDCGFIKADLLRGKLINQALKMTLVDTFLRMDDAGLLSLQGQMVPSTAPEPHPDAIVDPEEAYERRPETRAVTGDLYDAETFRGNLWLCIWAAVRAFNMEGLSTVLVEVQDKVLKKMRKNGGTITTGQLTQMCLKINDRLMSVREVAERVMFPMIDDGRIVSREGRQGTPVYSLVKP